ncbi:MAG: hypothetical protein GY850_17590 [bacterium]|jgi:predicted methyltransferase|nr:hypothetical protein [bacterium]
MRGALLIGLAVVLLIIGVLVMKDMGADSTSGIQETQAEAYMEKAKVAAEDVDKRFKDIKKSAD